MRNKLKVGIIGCGAIGSEIALFCRRSMPDKLDITALYDTEPGKAAKLARRLKKNIAVKSLNKIFILADIVIEAASPSAAPNILSESIKRRKKVFIMSVGGLIASNRLIENARRRNVEVYFPSGAICGIDGLKSAVMGRLKKIRITTRKPPAGLVGAPYLRDKKIDLKKLKAEKLIFEGDAAAAAKSFPKNINVASLLNIAAGGNKKVMVRIIASPGIARNRHEIEIEGNFGKITTITENLPFKSNPRTSRLAALSAIATLKSVTDSVKIGT